MGEGKDLQAYHPHCTKTEGQVGDLPDLSVSWKKKKKSPKEPSLYLSNLSVFLILYLLVVCCNQGTHSFTLEIEWEAYILTHFLGDGVRKEKGPLISSLKKNC